MTKPYTFQLEDVDRIEAFNGRCLIANEMGTGKSLTTLLYAKNHPDLRPIIIVCPASIKWNWENEIKLHVGSWTCEIIEGMTVKKKRTEGTRVWIINYDILGPWLDFLKSLKPQLVILDECHMIKSQRARRTKNTRKLCKGVPHVLALSGTPLTNRPAELFSVLNLLRPDLYPAFYPFATEFCQLRRVPWGGGWVYNGAKDLDKLHRQLKSELMVRRKKLEVLKDLPPKTREIITLTIDKPREYEEAERDLVSYLAKTSPRRARRVMSAEKMVKIGYLKRLAAQLKLNSVCEWVDNFLEESDGKLILFAVHKKIISHLEDRYKALCVVVDGSVIGRNRQKSFKQFQNDKRTRVFIGNVQAAGVGWNGTVANDVAFAELPWTPGELVQAEDRAWRIGTKRHVTIHYLIGKGTIESDLCRILQRKQRVLDTTLDGGRQKDSLAIYDQLAKVLLERR